MTHEPMTSSVVPLLILPRQTRVEIQRQRHEKEPIPRTYSFTTALYDKDDEAMHYCDLLLLIWRFEGLKRNSSMLMQRRNCVKVRTDDVVALWLCCH
jgi:hypothetical protein